ncbi:hypothetical protein BDZ45DRAFT_608551 [Acephala macrosclerotiorum]|nr:hypothetical protein BDZ45DRAFT_608551 [Acephala macrosclerotiorum]
MTSSSTSNTSIVTSTQIGIVSSCTDYYVTKSGDSCASIEAAYGISIAEFYAWNPAVGSNCESLWLDETYCVAAPSQAGISASCTDAASTTTTAAAATPPGPTQTGITSACNVWTVVDAFESEYDITFDQFYAWNPAVGASCTNLWVGEAYCVGVMSSSKLRRGSHLALHALHPS